MELSANYQNISDLKRRLSALSDHLDVNEKRDRLEEVRLELENSEIWSNPDKAKALGKEKVQLGTLCSAFKHSTAVLNDAKELLEMAEAENDENAANRSVVVCQNLNQYMQNTGTAGITWQ